MSIFDLMDYFYETLIPNCSTEFQECSLIESRKFLMSIPCKPRPGEYKKWMIILIMYKQTIIIYYDGQCYIGQWKGLVVLFVCLHILKNKNPWSILTGNKNEGREKLFRGKTMNNSTIF